MSVRRVDAIEKALHCSTPADLTFLVRYAYDAPVRLDATVA